MNVTKTEAAEALDVIARSRDQMLTLRRYARFAPLLFIWGGVWVAANGVTDFAPAWGDIAWPVGSGIGLILSILWGIRIRRWAGPRTADSASARLRVHRRVMLGVALCCYFPAVFVILGPLAARQMNAFISLFWAFAYMVAGVWVGWRLFAIGAVAAAAIVFGYLAIGEHFYLWMALCGGGTLIAGALWLRKI